jgi:membrane protein insertase Oxa1/YidC/SpoIIIJ
MVSSIDHPSSLLHHHSFLLLSAIDETAFTTADAAARAVAESPAAAAADGGNGWLGFLTLPIEYSLQAIHGALATSAIGTNAWGVSIIVMTVVIKAATYPLTRSQLESTNKMQVRQKTNIYMYIYIIYETVYKIIGQGVYHNIMD